MRKHLVTVERKSFLLTGRNWISILSCVPVLFKSQKIRDQMHVRKLPHLSYYLVLGSYQPPVFGVFFEFWMQKQQWVWTALMAGHTALCHSAQDPAKEDP